MQFIESQVSGFGSRRRVVRITAESELRRGSLGLVKPYRDHTAMLYHEL